MKKAKPLKSVGMMALAVVSLSGTASAFDVKGNYIVGGGVGGVSCTSFLTTVTEAQRLGGPTSLAGANKLSVFDNYVLGAQTGYNVGVLGTADIFATLGGASPSEQARNWIERWCQQNPRRSFGVAVTALIEALNKQ